MTLSPDRDQIGILVALKIGVVMLRFGVLTIALLLPGLALGADGVREINQAEVLAAGGFPHTIAQSGSYKLTGNLTVPLNTTGIVISAGNVHLDLGGFAILGAAGSTSGNGIDGSAALRNVIRNGTVRDFGGTGVQTGARARVEEIRAIANGVDGIATADRSQIVNSLAQANGQDGIDAGSVSIVRKCVSHDNTGDGIEIGIAGIAIDNVSSQNDGDGINGSASAAVLARGNEVHLNRGDGVRLSSHCLAVSNRVVMLLGLPGTALSLGSGCGYAYNLLFAGTGTTVSGGVDVSTHGASNLCDDDTTCP